MTGNVSLNQQILGVIEAPRLGTAQEGSSQVTSPLSTLQRYAGLIAALSLLSEFPDDHLAKRAIWEALLATRNQMTRQEEDTLLGDLGIADAPTSVATAA